MYCIGVITKCLDKTDSDGVYNTIDRFFKAGLYDGLSDDANKKLDAIFSGKRKSCWKEFRRELWRNATIDLVDVV